MDGAAKPLLEVGGRSLLRRAVDAAATAGCRPITIVADRVDDFDAGAADVQWVREDPPFGGPAAATVTALSSWERGPAPEWTLLLACDLPRVDAVVPRLVAAMMLLPSDTDGVCLSDATGRPQWLTGLYRTAALRDAASALPGRGRDARVRALLDDLSIAVVRGEHGEADDVDTWEDLTRARGEAAGEEER